jgi:hypothetical protein
MMWTDYNIDQVGSNFKVVGDWPGEVMGKNKDGSDKGYALYRPGDVFIVDDNGWLVKSDQLSVMVMKYEANKNSSDA